MAFLRLDDLAPDSFIASETDETGQRVRDLVRINLNRVIWVEAEPAALTLRFQIDRDSWLRVVFADKYGYAQAAERLTAAAV